MTMLWLYLAWLGAVLWFGSLQIRCMLAANRITAYSYVHDKAYTKSEQKTLSRLHGLMSSGTGAIIIGTLGVVLAQKTATPVQAICSFIAALTLIGLVFHVEHYLADHIPFNLYKWLSVLMVLLNGAIGVSCSLPLLSPTFNPTITVFYMSILLACGALLGTLIASAALIPLLEAMPTPQREQLRADIGARWTIHMGSSAAILAIAGGGVAQMQWGSNHLTAILSAIGLAIPFIMLISLRITIHLRLDYALAAMPIVGMAERSLRGRTHNFQTAARHVMRLGIVSTLLTMIVIGITLALVILPNHLPQTPTVVSPRLSPIQATPSITPITAPGNVVVAQQDNGVTITLASGPLSIGANTLHLMLTNSQGQAMPGASITVVLNALPPQSDGMTIQAQPDASSNPSDFTAAIVLTHAGSWHISVLVATADQSISAHADFAVNITGKA